MIDKAKAKEMAEELNKWLISMAAKHGLKHYPHRLSWTPVSCSMKIEFEAEEAADARLDELGLFRRGDKVHDAKGDQFIVKDAWKGLVYMEKWPGGGSYKVKPEGLQLLQRKKEMEGL